MKKIKERFEPNDILTLSSGFLARYAGSNKYNDIERFQNNLFIWVRDEVAEGRRFNSHIEALEAFIAERDEYRRTHNTYEIEVFESVRISQEGHDIILEKGDRIRILSEAIPQEKLVRATVWDEVSRNYIPNEGKKEYGFKDEDIIGWFATSHNPAGGWLILKANDFDKREFGSEVFRSYSEWTNSTNIVKFNLLAGTFAFVDAQYYSDTDSVRFERMTKYNRLFIEPTQTAFEEFNII